MPLLFHDERDTHHPCLHLHDDVEKKLGRNVRKFHDDSCMLRLRALVFRAVGGRGANKSVVLILHVNSRMCLCVSVSAFTQFGAGVRVRLTKQRDPTSGKRFREHLQRVRMSKLQCSGRVQSALNRRPRNLDDPNPQLQKPFFQPKPSALSLSNLVQPEPYSEPPKP